MKFKDWAFVLLIVYFFLMIGLAVMPSSTISGIGGDDKLLHFIEFFVFGMILFTTLHFHKYKNFSLVGFFVAGFVIIVSEVVQLFTSTRTFSFLDIVADIVGVLFAYFIVLIARKK